MIKIQKIEVNCKKENDILISLNGLEKTYLSTMGKCFNCKVVISGIGINEFVKNNDKKFLLDIFNPEDEFSLIFIANWSETYGFSEFYLSDNIVNKIGWIIYDSFNDLVGLNKINVICAKIKEDLNSGIDLEDAEYWKEKITEIFSYANLSNAVRQQLC